MTKSQPNVSPTYKYELREAAKALDVSTSTIVKWTNKGILRASTRRANGRRVWSGEELIRAWKATM